MFRLCILFVCGMLAGVALYGVMPTFWWLGLVFVMLLALLFLRNAVTSTLFLYSVIACCGAFIMSLSIHGLEERVGEDAKVGFNNVSRLAYLDRKTSHRELFSDARKQLSERFRDAGFEDEEYSIITAMTLGDKQFITKELRDVYSKTGASHVLALSGLHLGIIFFVLTYILYHSFLLFDRLLYLLWLRLPVNRFSNGLISIHPEAHDMRNVAFVVTCLFIWVYVFLVGAMPSVVRAATMLSLYTFLVVWGREKHSVSVLALTAVIMLVINPLSLLDIGFQMSFLAVLGILLFFSNVGEFYYRLFPLFAPFDDSIRSDAYTKQNNLLYRIADRIMKWLWDGFSLALSAQLFVLPLVVFYFGNIPFLSVFFSPFISFSAIIIVSVSLAFLLFQSVASGGVVLAFLASSSAKILSLMVSCQNKALEYVASLSFSHIDGIHISLPQLIILYVIIFSVLAIIKKITQTFA